MKNEKLLIIDPDVLLSEDKRYTRLGAVNRNGLDMEVYGIPCPTHEGQVHIVSQVVDRRDKAAIIPVMTMMINIPGLSDASGHFENSVNITQAVQRTMEAFHMDADRGTRVEFIRNIYTVGSALRTMQNSLIRQYYMETAADDLVDQAQEANRPDRELHIAETEDLFGGFDLNTLLSDDEEDDGSPVGSAGG